MSSSSSSTTTTDRRRICVVGCNGFIGSHITKLLLENGDDVVGVVRCSVDDERVSWLSSLPNASPSSLILKQAAPSTPGACDDALKGCVGCIVASGINDPAYPEWPEEMVALTNNILESCKTNNVKRFVLLTSTGTTNPPTGEPEFKREDEHFSDPVLQRTQGKFASCAKTLAEQAAFEFGKANGIRVCAICPSAVMGPQLAPGHNQPHDFIMRLLTGEMKWEKIPNGSMSFVDVRDLAALHVAALNDDNANGRFFGVCSNSAHFADIAATLHTIWPSFVVPPPPDNALVRPTHFDLSKQQTLGVQCRSIDQVLKDHVEWLVEAGHLTRPSS
eukprot:TRINITY_DN1335_c0_g1_i1.p1 TRINITY_DN1335_c0_g1~~TRINITY_DN1335_c0_g1_i1.p1  ORF type:complete len:339 (+),score=71.50 TRINITY_DN1335_c0_g1_i1:22-1017(+)